MTAVTCMTIQLEIAFTPCHSSATTIPYLAMLTQVSANHFSTFMNAHTEPSQVGDVVNDDDDPRHAMSTTPRRPQPQHAVDNHNDNEGGILPR